MANPRCKICGRWIDKNHKCPEKNWNSGEKNPMYGKVRTMASRIKQGMKTKGIPKSEEQKRKMSLSWDYNKHITPETILKMKKSKKGKLLGKDNPNYGNKWNDKQRRIASIRMTGKKNPTLSKMNHDNYVSGKNIFPKKDTTIEVKIQNLLSLLHIEFFTHKYMHIKHGYQCDIFIPEQEGITQKTIIECFGDYWHKIPYGNPVDSLRCQELREQGYRVLVFWENEIRVMKVNDLRDKIYGK